MNEEEMVEVPRWAVTEVVSAMCGPPYLLNELKAISALRGDKCPLRALVTALEKGKK